MHSPGLWLRSPRFDLSLQLVALGAIAPVLVVYAALDASRASTLLPLGVMFTVPFLHVFASFFVAFSGERNHSPTPPARLARYWAMWIVLSLALQALAPRALATFALVYGGWHIFRQNFGFLRELAARGGFAGERAGRWLDQAACAAPAVALWLLVATRGPWGFLGADIWHVAAPPWLLALAFAAVPATALVREIWVSRRGPRTSAALLLLGGNALALLAPALLLDDLMLIYTLSASYHGLQYLAYVAERERELHPHEPPARVLAPLASMVLGCMLIIVVAWMLASAIAPARAEEGLALVWYAMVPFHYFVDGRIW